MNADPRDDPRPVETIPDQSAELDREAIAEHVHKLVAARAWRARNLCLRRRGEPLSWIEVVAVTLAVLGIVLAAGYALLALLT